VPTAVWTVAFFVIPLALITVFSFGTENLVTFNVDFGWTASNYAAFGSGLYVSTLLRSLALSLGTTAACALLGFPLAFFISLQAPGPQRVLLACVTVPFWPSFLVRTYWWVNLLQTNGPIARLAFGTPGQPLQSLSTPASIAVGMTYSYLPLM